MRESNGQIAMIEIEARKEAASRTARLNAVFAALADPTRRAIIERLSRSEARVTEVAEPFHMSLNAVSKHIRVLEASGVVAQERARPHSLHQYPFARRGRWLDRADAPLLGGAAGRHGAPAARAQEGPQARTKGSQAWFAVTPRAESCRYAGA